MGHAALDPAFIRCSGPREIVEHFRAILQHTEDEELTRQLIGLVKAGSLPPSVFGSWLGVVQRPSAIQQCLAQNVSLEIRRLALKRLRKKLRSLDWRATWDGLGGVSGVAQLFRDFSVAEVKQACRIIACSSKGIDVDAKRKLFTQLLEMLVPQLSSNEPSNSVHHADERPLRGQYHHLLPACSREVVNNVLERNSDSIRDDIQRRLLLEHADTLQLLALQHAFAGNAAGKNALFPLLSHSPPKTTFERGFSESMRFSFDILEKTANEGQTHISNEDFVNKLVEPLLRRAIRKKTSWSKTRKIIELVARYVDRRPSIAKELSIKRGGVLHLVVLCWSRRSEVFESYLELLLSCACSHKAVDKVELVDFEPLMTGIANSRRYALLRFVFKVVTGRDIDVSDDLKGPIGTLSHRLLYTLRPPDALNLFTRIRSVQGDDQLVGKGPYYDSILELSATPDGTGGDPDMWQVVLLQRNGHQKEAENIAIDKVRENKRAAISAPIPEQRAFYAKSAMHYAIASGSLEMYKAAVAWSRRFIRDPLVVKELYQQIKDETKTLLSGIPEATAKDISVHVLRQRVVVANQIMKYFWETACLALGEPAFASYHWHGTLSLPFHAVQERRRRASSLKRIFGLSDEEMYDILWKDTVEMLVAVEDKILTPGHKALRADSFDGILHYRCNSQIDLQNDEPPTYSFFDNLAKARNDLWCKFRPTIHPAVAALPDPFPRGLPLQHLTKPYLVVLADLASHAPYIASRVNAAIFPDPKMALTPFPDDEEKQAAIGVFVDSFAFALRLWVPKILDDAEKRLRIDRAWAHATGPLSQNRMTPEEATRYWQKDDIWPQSPTQSSKLTNWPVIPDVEDNTGIQEWNPVPAKAESTNTRKLELLTYVDVSKYPQLGFWAARWTVHSSLKGLIVTIPGTKAKDKIWSLEHIKQAKRQSAIREGQTISALLYLDSINSANSRILAKPFPSPTDARYPAIYLDEQFLAGSGLDENNALIAIEEHLKSVPPTLLAQVTDNTLQSLHTTDSKELNQQLRREAFRLLKALGQSDRPSLASQLAVRTIVARPEASSWHRSLLSRGFFHRLPVSHAEACITNFADAVIAKLEEQKRTRDMKETKDPSVETLDSTMRDREEKSQPVVKVTTVKLLAQLLNGAEFVSEAFALAVLTKLLHKTTQVDIRRAVVSSLISMLASAVPELAKNILVVLESIVPLAGNLRERRPITEDEWIHATETPSPPEIDAADTYDMDNSAPILSLLIKSLQRQTNQSPDIAYRREYIERIILPIVHGLRQQTARWVSIFLRKYSFGEDAQKEIQLPALPCDKMVLTYLLQNGTSHVPLSLLEEYVAYLTFNIAPPASIIEFNKRLSNDPSLKTKKDVQTWLTRFGDGPSIVTSGHMFSLTYLLDESSHLTGQITAKAVQEQYLKLYTIMLWHDKETQRRLQYITRPLWENQKSVHNPIDKEWGEHYKPIVEAIILYVESLRSREWQKDPNRQPIVLPDTWKFRMWILKYAAQYSPEAEAGDREAHCRAFSGRVTKIIDQIAGSLYHAKFAKLRKALRYVRDDDRLRVACYLGDITKTRLSWLTMQDILRVELAAELLDETTENKELTLRVYDLIESWKRAESEEVRRFGYDKATFRSG